MRAVIRCVPAVASLAGIWVTDDGTKEYDYAALGIVAEFYELATGTRRLTPAGCGPRTAASAARKLAMFRQVPEDAIIATLDSDSVQDCRANEEGLKPFADPEVMSVAAIILAYNTRESLLTRLTDPWLMAFQLCVRAALSKLNSVLVNSRTCPITGPA